MKTTEEIWQDNRFNELHRKYEQTIAIADGRITNLQEKIDVLSSQIKHYETIVEYYYKLMKQSINESQEARARLIEAGEGSNKETLEMIKELGVLINKWRGDDY